MSRTNKPRFFTVSPDGFVDPEGKPFWSFGVDCVTAGEDWRSYNLDNPGYAAWQHFADVKSWVDDTLGKLRSWGFNSLGGWSENDLFAQYAPKERLPYFVVLHLGAYDEAPWHDMFAPHFENAVRAAAKELIPKTADDPMLVGYFSDNELGWWGDTLFLSYMSLPQAAPGKKRLIETLERHYGGDFVKLKANWNTDASDFDELAKAKKITIKPGG
ncbi:MAG TPA: hypothetical protein VMI31_06625, partial [Fimbriimonadaceae bacterium]|nr:hypothetical protein [Fimbriimonadaceae bacterium]